MRMDRDQAENPGRTRLQRARIWAEIDLPGLCGNCRRLMEAVAPAEVMAVTKADAYGLGVRPVARALAEVGVARFGVATPEEALSLLDLGLPVQILGGVLPAEIPALVAHDVVWPLTDLSSARRIGEAARRHGRKVRAHFKIDTGMGRLGIPLPEALATIRAAWDIPGLVPEGIYSHLPMTCRLDDEGTRAQIDGFVRLLEDLAREGRTFKIRHIAHSAAVNHISRAYAAPFNMVRMGINLYGALDDEEARRLALRPVVTLKTRLVAIRRLPAGHTIGYERTYRLPKATTVGTLAAGYADGLPMALSNRGHVLVGGRACPVLGRLSMDYTTIALDRAPGAAVGDEVICLGGEGPRAIPVSTWADLKGTHPYDIMCSFGNRVLRCYRNLDGEWTPA